MPENLGNFETFPKVLPWLSLCWREAKQGGFELGWERAELLFAGVGLLKDEEGLSNQLEALEERCARGCAQGTETAREM